MKKLALALLLAAAGCATPFFRSVQGTSTSIGVTIPNEEVVQLEALHYLNGEKVTVREPAYIKYWFKAAETNRYFGMISTETCRESDLTISLTNNVQEANNERQ